MKQSRAFRGTVLVPLGQAGVWPEKLPGGEHGMRDLVWGVDGEDPHLAYNNNSNT